MAKFKVFHQVTFDEYFDMQDDLFPEVLPVPVQRFARRSLGAGRSVVAPIFPGAVDGVGAVPAEPAPVDVVYSKYRRRVS